MAKRLLLFKNEKYIEISGNNNDYSYDQIVEMPTEFKKYSIKGIKTIGVSQADKSHVVLPGSNLKCYITSGELNVLSGTPYLNGKLVGEGVYRLVGGDRLYSNEVEMYFGKDHIGIRGAKYEVNLENFIDRAEEFENFSEYKRSPRLIKREPRTSIELTAPPKKTEKKKGELAKLIIPPIATAFVTGLMSFILGRGIMVLIALCSTLVSVVVSVTNYVQNKKELQKEEKERRDAYEKYLLNQQQVLADNSSAFIESRKYHNPSIKEIESMVSNYSHRLYERKINDGDFINISLGVSECKPSFNISAKFDDVEYKNDNLYDAMKSTYNEFCIIKDVPVIVDLKKSHLGIVGEKEYIHNQLFSIITQLCFMQSYHDLEIVTLLGEKSKSEFDWIKWFPHCKIQAINVSAVISGENQRDQVLGNLTQVFKMRKMYKEEKKYEGVFVPHYIFVIEEPKLLLNHSIMEYLQTDISDIGFSMIYATDQLSNLPENIKTILLLDSDSSGKLLMNEGKLENLSLKTNVVSDVCLSRIARRIASIKHNKGISSQIPDSITFFDMYGVKKPKDIPVADLWERNASYKSLAVPLGVRGKDDIVYLNLHEKAHGPHGLVAGTTGSGKSEILQSYILSLAVNFHPYEVGFLLIDYKGGGMANLFKNLPHLLGTITNLDGGESMRALASIQAENRRRQRIFGEIGVNNISQYTKMFRNGEISEPLPHLFIISDEFAELKKEQPEFMKELVSTARIGRSLGVHLILATQKPSGIVDDQIWSNSRFKLALKVQNESDSKEVIKTPDAAKITQAGRAILQVGNNEIYETFQSAWSGAAFSEEQEKNTYDKRVYLINDLGQGVLVNKDLSDTTSADKSKTTQLDTVVAHLKKVYDQMKCKSVTRPWLPPLMTKIVSPHIEINQICDCAIEKAINSGVGLGVIDLPDLQMQREYSYDFQTDGNLIVFGASGYGKSTLLTTLALSYALKNSPKLLKFYILDLGNSALLPLKDLPHTADYLSFDDMEKLKKLVVLLTDEIASRKKLFARSGAINHKMYNSIAEEQLPAIVFYIDNYDVLRELGTEFEESVTRITRDGVSVGIFTVIAASRTSVVRYAVLNNFKNKICNFTFDSSEIHSIVGRTAYELQEIKGRALIKLKEPAIMQEYLPVNFEDEIQYAADLREIVQTIANKCSEKKACGIPMLPEELSLQMLLDIVPSEEKRIAIGLDTESVQPQYLSESSGKVIIVGGTQTGKTNVLNVIFSQLNDAIIFISDSKTNELYDKRVNPMVTYMSEETDCERFIGELENLVSMRKQEYMNTDRKKRPREYFANLPRVVVMIDDGDHFVELTKNQAKRMEAILAEALAVGAAIITTTLPTKLKGYDPISKFLRETGNGIITGSPNEQNILQVTANRAYKPKMEMSVVVSNGRQVVVMVPKV